MKSHRSRIVRLLLFFWVWSIAVVRAKRGSVRNIKVNVSGKDFTVSRVSTVGELQLRIQQETGMEPIMQGNVMFGEQRLSPMDKLKDVGVSNGSEIQIVPTAKRKPENESTSENVDSNPSWDEVVAFAVDCFDETRRLGKTRWKNDVPQALVDLMMLVQKVTRSSVFERYMAADPKEFFAEIERFRQFANERQVTNTMQNMPLLMKRALNDPVAWRELTLWNIREIKKLDLDGAHGKRLLQDLRALEASGLMTDMPPGFYNFINGTDGDL